MAGREHDVADEGDDDRGESGDVGRPGRADRSPDSASLVLEHHVTHSKQRHHAQERERVHVGQGANSALEEDEQRGAEDKERDGNQMIRPPEPILRKQQLGHAAIKSKSPHQPGHPDVCSKNGSCKHEGSVCADPQAEILSSRIVRCLGQHVPVVRFEGGKVEDAQADDGEERVEAEDDEPGVEQRFGEHAPLLLLDVVRRRLEPRDSQHRRAEAEEDGEGPVVLERLLEIVGEDRGVLEGVQGPDKDQKHHRAHVDDKDADRNYRRLCDPHD
mmetsp:Transcript_31028/g.69847  ORF Transcript_31028/g.69847 Transcript_31028/m.69847 type:complete len:273 (-) Transcript_31028:839-1657(-)